MPPRRRTEPQEPGPRFRPATTPKAREDQLIELAADLAERQLREGTASAQVITQILKLGSTRERLEQERIRLENEFMEQKTEALKSQQRVEELYAQALDAMRAYSGQIVRDDDEDEYYD